MESWSDDDSVFLNFDRFERLIATAIRDAVAEAQQGERKQWEYGVVHFHDPRNPEFIDRFYHVVNDLREASCIIDIWLNDIQQTLKEFGYDMVIYMPPESRE